MCTSPNRIFYTGLKTDSGADLLYFDTHYPCPDLLPVRLAEKQLKRRIPFDPSLMKVINGQVFLTKFRDIPCGKCDEDRFTRSKEWAFRILMESKYHCDNWFLTLTFSDVCLPEKVSISDIQDFVKRLRQELKTPGMKFYATGEYGEKSGRAHYHLVLLGCKLDGLKVYDGSKGEFVSDTIARCWPYGAHVLAEVTLESVCYVARYTAKKSAEKFGFCTMSNRPGLGYRYLQDHRGSLDCDYLPLFVNERLLRVKPPRYCEKIMPDRDWKGVKDRRVENATRKKIVEMAHHQVHREGLDDYKRNVAACKARKLEKNEI